MNLNNLFSKTSHSNDIKPVTSSSYTKEAQCILIVDDDSDFADSLDDLLRLHQYNTVLANDFQQAIELAKSTHPQIALLDIRLGQTSGVSLIQELKKVTPETQCIMLTGFASLDTAITAMRSGAYDYITKPPHPEELLLTVERCLQQLQLQKQKDIKVN